MTRNTRDRRTALPIELVTEVEGIRGQLEYVPREHFIVIKFGLTEDVIPGRVVDMKLYISLKDGGEIREASDMGEAHEIMTQWARDLGGTPDFRMTRADVVCDFCSEPGIVALYQITPGTLRSVEIRDGVQITHMDEDGLWGACPTCDEIIEYVRQGNVEEGVSRLRERSVTRFIERGEGVGVPRDLVEWSVSMGHNFFFAHWNLEASKPLMTDAEMLGGS